MNATTYAGITPVTDPNTPYLGGNIKEGDPYTFCPRVWTYVIERFCIRSVLDLGSGIGNAADWFFKKGPRTVAVDGLQSNIADLFYPTICHDLTKSAVFTKVDLVHCQEVVEHIEEHYINHLLESLACGRVVLITHALPEQGGHHHVNLKAADYWIGHMAGRGFNFMTEDSNRVRDIAKQEGAVYMANSGLLFHRR